LESGNTIKAISSYHRTTSGGSEVKKRMYERFRKIPNGEIRRRREGQTELAEWVKVGARVWVRRVMGRVMSRLLFRPTTKQRAVA